MRGTGMHHLSSCTQWCQWLTTIRTSLQKTRSILTNVCKGWSYAWCWLQDPFLRDNKKIDLLATFRTSSANIGQALARWMQAHPRCVRYHGDNKGKKKGSHSQARCAMASPIVFLTTRKSRQRPSPCGKRLPTKEYLPEERRDKFICRRKEVRYCIMFCARFVGWFGSRSLTSAWNMTTISSLPCGCPSTLRSTLSMEGQSLRTGKTVTLPSRPSVLVFHNHQFMLILCSARWWSQDCDLRSP